MAESQSDYIGFDPGHLAGRAGEKPNRTIRPPKAPGMYAIDRPAACFSKLQPHLSFSRGQGGSAGVPEGERLCFDVTNILK